MLLLMPLLLPSLSNAELLQSDLEDSRSCEALLGTENSELLVLNYPKSIRSSL